MMARDWKQDFNYSELIFRFILRRKKRATKIWDDILEKGLPTLEDWSTHELFLIKSFQQWVRSSNYTQGCLA